MFCFCRKNIEVLVYQTGGTENDIIYRIDQFPPNCFNGFFFICQFPGQCLYFFSIAVVRAFDVEIRLYFLYSRDSRFGIDNCHIIDLFQAGQDFCSQILVKNRPARAFSDIPIGSNRYDENIPVLFCTRQMSDMSGMDEIEDAVAVDDFLAFFFQLKYQLAQFADSFDFPAYPAHAPNNNHFRKSVQVYNMIIMAEKDAGKKFHGWVSPDRHASFIGPLVNLRQTAHVVSIPSPEKEPFLERFIYVGCLHGGNKSAYDRLEALAENPPAYLIFTGDLAGSPEIEKLKKHFYDDKETNRESVYRQYAYFGDWAATLPLSRRRELLATLEPHAARLLKIIRKIKNPKTKIYILEGNWDNPQISGVRAIAGKDISAVFDTQAFFHNHGFPFTNRPSLILAETSLHILLPYISLLHLKNNNKLFINKFRKAVSQYKKLGKSVVMVGHAEANWRIHHLNRQYNQLTIERKTVIDNFGRLMAIFQPDEVIYPHQHARLHDEQGNLLEADSKYALHVRQNGVSLVEDADSIRKDDATILASYIPLGFLAEENF